MVKYNPFESFDQDDIDEFEDAMEHLDCIISEKNPDRSRHLAPFLFVVDGETGDIHGVCPKEFDSDTINTLMRHIGKQLSDPSMKQHYLFEGEDAGSSGESQEDAEGTEARA